jgi:hypothetical protein
MSEITGLLNGTRVHNGKSKIKPGPMAPFLTLSNRANIQDNLLNLFTATNDEEKNPNAFASSQKKKANPNFGLSQKCSRSVSVPLTTKSE